jgi:hypothetical protein
VSCFERIVRRVPGFAGYSDARHRRSSDRALRQFVATRIDRIVPELHVAAKEASQTVAAEIGDVIDDLESIRCDLSHADRDYAGFFTDCAWDRVDVLGPVYARDDQIVETLVVLSVSIEEGNFTPPHLGREVRHLHRTLSERSSAMLTLAQSWSLQCRPA